MNMKWMKKEEFYNHFEERRLLLDGKKIIQA